jgi:hypothetical protein
MKLSNGQASPARRNVIGGLAAVAVATLGGAAWKLNWFGKHYAATPYDDLLGQIVDREPASQLGAVAVRKMPGFNLDKLAARLRQPGQDLKTRARLDAGQNLVVEAAGWLVPQSVALYAALAAKV